MFKREERDGKFIGFSLERSKAFLFFGGKNLRREDLNGVFPQFEFHFLKQIHGKDVVASGPPAEADAHFTSERGVALVSQTADCIPVLLGNDSTVCAIHSGWKGTALNIIGATRDVFQTTPPEFAAIGPHILRPSFEVGLDVANQLLAAAPGRDGLLSSHKDPAKTYFDLTELARRQIHQAFGERIELLECLEDTLTNSHFHSFRRDKQRAGRQYSFVVLKS